MLILKKIVPIVALTLILPAFAKKNQITVTNGTVERAGWENQLIHRNPGLKHWHWNPVYSTIKVNKIVSPKHSSQPYVTKLGRTNNQNRTHRLVYTKPIHIPINRNRKSTKLSGTTVFAKLSNKATYRQVSGNLRSKEVNSSLINEQIDGKVMPPKVFTYDNCFLPKQSTHKTDDMQVHGEVKSHGLRTIKK